jgi:hypothetical protein
MIDEMERRLNKGMAQRSNDIDKAFNYFEKE